MSSGLSRAGSNQVKGKPRKRPASRNAQSALRRKSPLSRKPRMKTCKSCRERFTPARSAQVVCSPRCAIEQQQAKRARDEKARERERKRQTRQRKEELKTRSELLKEAQAAFNAWVRERDHGLPCISCDRHHNGQWHASHYRSVGAAPELRFEPDNVHKSCQPCNAHLSGNLIEYRIRLIQKIGADRVAWLEGPHEPKRYTKDEIRDIKRQYNRMARELRKERESH